ncbi:MAG TPA: hypothetical protein VKQ72_00735 [Aggregatilineales bacterium]|nr:hypothetical protein [Aggregatilineales bacterium]
MRTSPVHVIVTVIALGLSALACNIALPSAPSAPIPTFVASPKDASDMEQSFRNAVNQASTTGNFNVSITQQQISSYLALNGAALAAQEGYQWPFKSVEVALNGGKITVWGVIAQQGIPDTPSQVVFTPSIDGAGQLTVTVDSGQIGIVGVPSSILADVTKSIRSLLTGQLAQIQGHYKLTALTINNGAMTVGGQVTN